MLRTLSRLEERDEAIKDIDLLPPPCVSLLDFCEQVHMFSVGSSDLDSVKAASLYSYLQRALDTWELPESEYDKVVKMLVQEAIRQYEVATA